METLKPETFLNVRPATAADLPAIIAIEEQADTAAHWSRRQYEESLGNSQPRHSMLVIEEASSIQGFLVAKTVAGEWEIENVAVTAAARRRGLGSLLLGTLLDQAREERAHAVFLEVRQSNLAARAFYRKFGFAETGRRKDYYRGPTEDAILYGFSLA